MLRPFRTFSRNVPRAFFVPRTFPACSCSSSFSSVASSASNGPLEAYSNLVHKGEIRKDPFQLKTINLLQTVSVDPKTCVKPVSTKLVPSCTMSFCGINRRFLSEKKAEIGLGRCSVKKNSSSSRRRRKWYSRRGFICMEEPDVARRL